MNKLKVWPGSKSCSFCFSKKPAAVAAPGTGNIQGTPTSTPIPLMEHHQQMVRASNDKRLVSKVSGRMGHLVPSKKLPFILHAIFLLNRRRRISCRYFVLCSRAFVAVGHVVENARLVDDAASACGQAVSSENKRGPPTRITHQWVILISRSDQ